MYYSRNLDLETRFCLVFQKQTPYLKPSTSSCNISISNYTLLLNGARLFVSVRTKRIYQTQETVIQFDFILQGMVEFR